MAYIKIIDEAEATGRLKEIYQKRKSHHSSKVSNIAKLFSLRPELLGGPAQVFAGNTVWGVQSRNQKRGDGFCLSRFPS